MKVFDCFQIISKLIILSLIITYVFLPIISLTTFNSTTAQNDDLKVINTFNEEDISTMGVKWSYHRPDSSPKGNSTSWKLRWSPDGEKIAVVYFDNTTIIFESKTGKVLKALGSSASIIMNPKGKTTKGDGTRTNGGEVEGDTRTRCWGYTTKPSLPIIRACAWSPDGKLLAISGDHRLIEIFNTTTWSRVKVLSGHEGSVLSLDWSPDGTRIASGEGTDQVLPHNQAQNKNYVNIWNMVTGKIIHTLKGHKDSVISVRWSNNSSRLVSASDDRNLKLWDADNGTLIYTLGEGIGHSAGVLDVDFSPNQTLLVSGSRDFKVRLWDLRTGEPLTKPWKDHNCVRSTHWHPNGKFIATSGVDQTLKIRNASTGKEIKIFTEAEETNSEVMSARWSPDGSSIATCSSRDATVRIYAIGFEEVEAERSDWIIGISIFFIICIIGLILIYIPLGNELRERRK